MANDDSVRFGAGNAVHPSAYALNRSPPDDSIDVTQLWGTVRDNARTVFAVAAIVFGIVMAFTMSSHMTFKSTARLYLGELAGKAAQSGDLDLSSAASSEASSEIEVLRSRSLIKRAVLASGLNVQIAPPGWEPPRFWRWLLSGRDLRLLDVVENQIAAKNTLLAERLSAAKKYKVKFISRGVFELSSESGPKVVGHLGETLTTSTLSLTLVAGKLGQPKAGSLFDLVVRPLEEVTDQALEAMLVTVPKPTGGADPVRVLTLDFLSSSPELAASFLRNLMECYLDARQAWKTEDAAAAESFVTKQLYTMQQSLDNTQKKLADYRAENRVVVHKNEAQAMVDQIARYEEQRVAARLQIASLRDIKRALQTPSAPLEAYMFGEANDDVLKELGSTLSESRQRLTDIESRYKGAAPEVQAQRKQVDAQLAMIGNYVTGRLARAEENLNALNGIINQFDEKLRTVPSAELRLAQIGRESEVYSRMYSYLLERQQQAAIIKASTVSKNRVLDTAVPAVREDTPKLGLHMLSSVIGLLLGAAIVIVRRLFSGVLRSESEIRGRIGPVPVFASVPQRLRIRGKSAESQRNPLFDVLAVPASDLGFAEAFRSLRANLYRTVHDSHGKVILVTSPSPGDGKTTCTLSLAAMLAADNRRVLAIDADVRKPRQHQLTGIPQEPGLRDLVLRVQPGWKDVVRTVNLQSGHFDCITAGAPAQAELLSDGYFATLLVHIRAHYDFVLVDSPSYPMVSDMLLLAPMCDFVLSVMRLANTPRRLAEEHLSGLMAVARGHAIVVNSAERALVYEYQALRSHGANGSRSDRLLESNRQRVQ